MSPGLILCLSFPLFFFRGLCLYFILVHSFFPVLGFSFCFCSYFFWLILSLWFPPLSSLDVCVACVYFSIVNFPWVPFSFAFLQASFVLPGSLAPLHTDVNTDCWFCWGKKGGRYGKTALRGLKERILGVGVEVVSCFAIHTLQTYISIPGQRSDTFPHRSSGFLNLHWLHSLSLPSLFLYPSAVELSFPLPNFLLSCFLWNMFYLLLLFSNISLMWNTHLEEELFLKSGRWLLIIAISVTVAYTVPMLTQGQKQDSRTHDTVPLGTDS